MSLTNIPLFKVFMSPESVENTSCVLQSGFISQGKQVEEFERRLKQYFNYPYLLTTNSATSGLILALRLLNLPSGSEVLCSPLTCFATTTAVLENRLKIKWVDVDKDTCNICLKDLALKISEKTKAVLFVHWAGSPVDLDKVREICKDIPVVEDCAHAFSAKYKGKHLGQHGNLAVYSFQAIKHLTTGDGGLLFCRNEEEYQRAKLLRWFGISREKPKGVDFRLEDDIKEWGYKFHMNDINASIGLGNLPYMNELTTKHKKNAEFYNRHFSRLFNVKILQQNSSAESAYWIYTLKVSDKNSFLNYMKEKEITASQVHNRNDIHSCVSEFKISLPQLDLLEKQIVSIPVGWWLTEEEKMRIITAVKDWDIKMGKEILIRELRREDKEEYLSLLEELNGVKCDFNKFDVVYTSLPLNNSEVYVLTVNNRIISTLKVILEPKFYDDVAHIEDVVTRKEHRGQGFGSMLLEFVKRKALKKAYKIVLSSKEQNLSFYKKNGFFVEANELVFRGKERKENK